MKRIAVLAAFLAAAQLSQAATINTPTVQVTATTGTWTFEQFQASNGTLTGVTFLLTAASYSGPVTMDIETSIPGQCTGTSTAQINVAPPQIAPIVLNIVAAGIAPCGTVLTLGGSVSNVQRTVFPFPNFDPFIGSGNVSLSYNTSRLTAFDGTARLIYTYDAAVSVVPEPATVGLMGFGLAALGLVRRRGN
jgi:hypothetical protein